MVAREKPETDKNNLQIKISELEMKLEEMSETLLTERKMKEFYQFIADFTFGWEIWFSPEGVIKYCSPSCIDLTGYTANQILSSQGIEKLLVYELDKSKFDEFVKKALDQMLVKHSLEFRILTRTKQLRWCNMSVRGVYDKKGKYLGVRASIQDITRLKRAMGHIQEMQTVKELEQRSKERLQNELSNKDRELVTFLLLLSQKNELLTKVRNTIATIEKDAQEVIREKISFLVNLLESEKLPAVDWQSVEIQIEKMHPGFFDRLKIKHPTISLKDKRLCGYIRLGLTSNEISGLLNITPRSVEIARVRLRKKLKLGREIRLTTYLAYL